MKKRSCRVYFIQHQGGLLTGLLLRSSHMPFDRPLPSAVGPDEPSVLAALDDEVARMQALHSDALDRYLWHEQLQTHSIRVEVLPMTAAHGRHAIGTRRVPIAITYAYSQLERGGYRVLVPRFDAQFVLEDLSVAAEVLRPFLLEQLLGADPQQLFDLRAQAAEYVRAWSPGSARRRADRAHEPDEDCATLRVVADELVDSAKRNKLAKTLGRCARLDWFEDTPGETPVSLLLVGPGGVGKSAWVRALAHHLREQPQDEQPKLWSSSAERIVAGLPYLGEWQARCLQLVRELEYTGDLFYVDRLLGIVEPQYEGTAIADFLEGPISDRAICVIAEATEQELTLARRRRASFVSRFEIVRLREPEPAQAAELLRGYNAQRPGPKLHPSSYRRLLSHLEVFARDRAMPGKGFAFCDWLAQVREGHSGEVLYPRDVSRAYAQWSGIPARLLADDEPAAPETFAAELAARVIGQPEACAVSGRVLARLKAAMTDPARPCATLMFAGPTGVGKTELAKQLAALAFGDERRFIRLDMSEYMSASSASRLLEAQDGTRSLANLVRQQPRALVLFDEIEKAHPRVLDLLLCALDEGRMTDLRGRAVDLRGTIIVMTSNLGVRARPISGFGALELTTSLAEVRSHFRPELWNRIDYVVPFRALGPEDMIAIVRLELSKLRQRAGLLRRNIDLLASEAAIAALARRGYDARLGARPLKREIEERVVAPLAARMAADPQLRDIQLRLIASSEAAARPWEQIVDA